jgi:hypothetical protein
MEVMAIGRLMPAGYARKLIASSKATVGKIGRKSHTHSYTL